MTARVEVLPGRLRALVTAVEKGQEKTARNAAEAVAAEFWEGPPRVGLRRGAALPAKSGKPWGVSVKQDRAGFLVSYVGPVHWFEGGTDDHFITPKGFVGSRKTRGLRAAAGTLKVSGSKVAGGAHTALKFGDGGVRRFAPHPGMDARPFFGRVKSESRPAATKTVQAGLKSNIVKAGFGR